MENVDDVAYNVYSFFKNHQDNLQKCFEKDDDVITLTSEATGIDRSKITKIISKRIRMKLDIYDNDSETFVRDKVIKQYWKTNKMPNIEEMYELLMKRYTISAPRKDVIKLLKKIGLEETVTPHLKLVIKIDQSSKRYVETIQSHRKKNTPIYYLNETFYWGSKFHEAIFKGDLPSLIMVHASGDAGFLDKKQIMVNYCSKNADDTTSHFENYDFMRDTILPNMSVPSVVVMNTQYSKYIDDILTSPIPDMNSTVVEMKNWLFSYGFHNSRNSNICSKIEMLQRISREVSKIEHSVGKITKESGHTVLCLPLNGSGLDPVTLIWTDIKSVNLSVLEEWPYSKWDKYFKYVKLSEKKCLAQSAEEDGADDDVAFTHSSNDTGDADLLKIH